MVAELTPRTRLELAVLSAMDSAGKNVMQWGVDDCGLWAADAVHEALGYDPAKDLRGRYRSRRGAMRVLGRDGLLGALRKVARRHKWKRINPEMARSGDFGLAWTVVETAKGKQPILATVICRAPGWFVGRNEKGFTGVPARDVAAAWSVLDDCQYGTRVSFPKINTRPVMVPASAVAHDPISAAIGLTALLSGTFLAGFGGVIVSVGLAVGFSLASSLLQKKLNASVDTSTTQAAQVTERQALPYKRVILGNAYVGGALFFEQTITPYLYQGILIANGNISGIDAITIGVNKIAFSGGLVPNTILTPATVTGQPSYPTRLLVSVRYGATNQAIDPLLNQDFPHLSLTPVNASGAALSGNMMSGAALSTVFDGNINKAEVSTAYLQGTGALTSNIVVDFGAGNAQTINAFQIYAPSDTSFTNNTVNLIIRISGSNDGSTYSDLYVEPSTLYDIAASLLRTFTNSTAYRYLRIQFEEQSAGGGMIHVVGLAQALLFSSGNRKFLQSGIATAVFRYHFGANTTEFTQLWGQVSRPVAYFNVRGAAAYDPRDATQSLSDPTTWKFTNNATLCQAYYLTQPWGGRIPTANILWDKITDSANYDDQPVACKDGTYIKRYTIDGVLTLNEKPYDVVPKLLTANRGLLCESAGKVWISSSKPKTPTFTISDKIIAGSFQFQSAKAKRDLVNKLQVRFVATEQDYQVIDGPILSRTDLQASDQEILPATLELDYTLDNRRAQRLQKAFLESSRLGKTITVPVDISLLANIDDELLGSVGNFASVLWPQLNGQYQVTGWGFSDDFSSISLALTQYDGSIETDWNAAVDEQPFTLFPIDLL
jgi:hypothetical protein